MISINDRSKIIKSVAIIYDVIIGHTKTQKYQLEIIINNEFKESW